jgi:AraC-like DNA-binding protein
MIRKRLPGKNKIPLKKRIIWRWASSYLAILFFPLLVFSAVSARFISTLTNEINYYYSLSADMIQTRVDYLLTRINSIAENITFSPEIEELLESDAKSDLSPLTLYNAAVNLSRHQTTKDQIDRFFIYFPSIDMVISDSTYNNAKDFYDIYFSGSSFEFDSWIDLIKNTGRTIRIADFSYKLPLDNSGYVFLIRPVSFIQRGRAYASIVFVLAKNRLFFVENSNDSRSLVISDRINSDIIYRSSDEPALSEKDLMAISVDSAIANWRYTIIQDKSVYQGKVTVIRWIFGLCVLLNCLFGLGFVFLTVKYNWQKLDNALKLTKNPVLNIYTAANEVKNEYQFFSKAISSLQEEKDAMSGRLQYQQLLLKTQIILGLVKNSAETKNITLEDLEYYGISFKSKALLVFLTRNDTEDAKYGQDVFIKNFDEAGLRTFLFYTGKYSGFVLNPDESGEISIYGRIAGIINSAKESVSGENRAEICCACSGIFYSYKELNKAYIQALDVMEYKNHEQENVVFYHEISGMVQRKNFIYSGEHEFHLAEEIKNGNSEEAVRIIHQIIDENKNNHVIMRMMRYLLFNILGTITKTYNSLEKQGFDNHPFDSLPFDNLPRIAMPDILESGDFERSCSEVEQTVRHICEAVKNIKTPGDYSQKDFALYKMTEYYVKRLYTNKMLNVSAIADELKFSAVHISKIFKKFSGIYLSDYINAVRLEHAKELLNSEETLVNIADKCGFGSFRTFMRVFKKQEGITPGQYKSIQNRK